MDIETKRFRLRSAPGGPALCKAIKAQVQALCDTIAEARQERAALAQGTADTYWWSWSRHDDSGLVAFAEGAGLTMVEARRICA